MIGMAKDASGIGIALPSDDHIALNAPLLVGEYGVRWDDIPSDSALYGIICYVNGYPHKRLLAMNAYRLWKRVEAWLADPTRIDP